MRVHHVRCMGEDRYYMDKKAALFALSKHPFWDKWHQEKDGEHTDIFINTETNITQATITDCEGACTWVHGVWKDPALGSYST